YNAGRQLAATVRAALAQWRPVWVVVDGSTDGSATPVQELVARDADVRVLMRPHNGGKGAAVATGIATALAEGYTHVLTMDSDGQHSAQSIPQFMAESQAHPKALVLYPAAERQGALASPRGARGFDFDPEMAVRLVWAGVPTVNVPAPCRYLAKDEGGVSHFHYVRDNLKLIWLHTRLLSQLLVWRWVPVARARRRSQ